MSADVVRGAPEAEDPRAVEEIEAFRVEFRLRPAELLRWEEYFDAP
ncbi:hypothetical protein OG948_36945 (plasmid) [Embleya sp. NBC_00888]|nr:hypothetical protein OG948_36945 [Embleya sp. NBC_00888]